MLLEIVLEPGELEDVSLGDEEGDVVEGDIVDEDVPSSEDDPSDENSARSCDSEDISDNDDEDEDYDDDADSVKAYFNSLKSHTRLKDVSHPALDRVLAQLVRRTNVKKISFQPSYEWKRGGLPKDGGAKVREVISRMFPLLRRRRCIQVV